jgi:pimeloyl-ACP methyl ester carboxylesterase
MEIQRGDSYFKTAVPMDPLPQEKLEGVEIQYGSVLTDRGQRLRTIVSRPSSSRGKLPGIFLVGWLSCDSVESLVNAADGVSRLLHGLATNSGFAMMRVDKPGVGDSEGICIQTDFQTELAGYRAALQAFRKLEFIDPERIFILGLSNGAGVAPLAAEGIEVKGYIVSGGWSKTWLEHMIELERRRLAILEKMPAQINQEMPGYIEFHTTYLTKKMTPAEVIRQKPHLAGLWYDLPEHQYGRPAAFYHQLQELNLAAAWSKVSQPVLLIYGEYDWIMSRSDHEWIAEMVNRNRPGAARFVAIPKMDHSLTAHETQKQAFENMGSGNFVESLIPLIMDWLKEQPAVSHH